MIWAWAPLMSFFTGEKLTDEFLLYFFSFMSSQFICVQQQQFDKRAGLYFSFLVFH